MNKGMPVPCWPGHWPPKAVGILPSWLACTSRPWEPSSWLSALPQCSAHLQLVLMLLVDPCKQLGFSSVEGVNEGITLGHQAGLKLHTVLLYDRAHPLATKPWALGAARKNIWGVGLPTEGNEKELCPQCTLGI